VTVAEEASHAQPGNGWDNDAMQPGDDWHDHAVQHDGGWGNNVSFIRSLPSRSHADYHYLLGGLLA